MSTTQKVKAYLRDSDLSRVSMLRVADRLNTTVSTLSRRLGQEGTSYQMLVIEERRWRCAEAIAENPKIGLIALAKRCGYADSTGMGRAFESWYCKTITEWRNDLYTKT